MDPIFTQDFHRYVLQDLTQVPPLPRGEPVQKFEPKVKNSEKGEKSKKEKKQK